MEIGDGLIRIYGGGEDDVPAFTDFGIENLIELVRFQQGKRQAAHALATGMIQPAAACAGCVQVQQGTCSIAPRLAIPSSAGYRGVDETNYGSVGPLRYAREGGRQLSFRRP
ncbi:hypothetical protein [Bradyrhizobium ivorense]|uniref:hypothetical protein n=1 Tax=Bradyrhizobium ivorense TaxID=2511166 RepID=UPI001FCF2253|nr:hypothetical protein [Bradyrhizobium ivorense]